MPAYIQGRNVNSHLIVSTPNGGQVRALQGLRPSRFTKAEFLSVRRTIGLRKSHVM